MRCDCTRPGQRHQDTSRFDHLATSAGTGTDSLRCCTRMGLILRQVTSHNTSALLNVYFPRSQCHSAFILITFCLSRRRREMSCGHPRPCVCLSLCLSAAVRPHYCTDPDVTWGRGSGRGCPLVVHYWAGLQSGHGLRCYGNITHMRNFSEYMLALALCLVTFCLSRRRRKMYCGHARLCVCLCVSVRGRMPTLLHGPGCNLGAW